MSNNISPIDLDEPETTQTRKLIPAYRDTFVHFLFGSTGHEPILLDFLNSVLESDGQTLARSVEARNPFNPQTFVADKYTILDIKATDERGDIFVVEFQTSERKTFADRLTYYGSRAFGSQIYLGDPYTLLRAVIAIAVTTFEMFGQLTSIHNSFRLSAKADPSIVLTNLLQMHVLEVTEAKIHRASQLPPKLCAWVNLFYYAHKKGKDEMLTVLQDQPVVIQAYEKFLQFNQDEQYRILDEAHRRFLHDFATDVEAAHNQGIDEGKIEGRVEEKGASLLRVLTARFQAVPRWIGDRIVHIQDGVVLDSLMVVAATCPSIQEFETELR